MAGYRDMYAALFGSITGDLFREAMDREIIQEVERLATVPSPSTTPPEEDEEENEEDMYLTRIGYLKEEKKPHSKGRVWEARNERGVGEPSSFVMPIPRQNPYEETPNRPTEDFHTTQRHNRNLNRYVEGSSGIEPPYSQSYRRSINDEYTHDEYTHHGMRRDSEEILRRVYEGLMEIVYDQRHLRVDAGLFRSILRDFKNKGYINNWYVDSDDMSSRIRVIIDKNEYRQSFFISPQDIWAINRRNGNG